MAPSRGMLVTASMVALVVLWAGCGEDEKGTQPAATTTMEAPVTSTTTTTTIETELTARSPVRLDGIGPVTMSMTLAQASAAVGRPVAVDPDSLISGNDTDLCGFARVEGGPEGLGFMVNRETPRHDWRIVRVDVFDDGTIATAGGIHVGSTEDDVRRVYGDKIKTEAHPYTGPQGHYMVLDVDGPGGMKLVFETDGKRVLTYRSGLQSAVEGIEGCV